jgi:small neutral amino acid transporter SnatA (MarC family)
MRGPDTHRATTLRTLVPLAVGHMASVAVVCAALVSGQSMDRQLLQALAAALLVAVVVVQLSGRTPRVLRALTGHAGWALGSFAMSTAHGAGLALVPASMPFCVGDASAGEAIASEALSQAIVAVLVHAVAMLAVTGLLVAGVQRGLAACIRWPIGR